MALSPGINNSENEVAEQQLKLPVGYGYGNGCGNGNGYGYGYGDGYGTIDKPRRIRWASNS